MHNSLVSNLLLRLLLLFALLTGASIVVLTKCGFNELTTRETLANNPSESSGFSYTLSEREAEIERLKQEVLDLHTQILFLQNNRSTSKPSNGILQLQETNYELIPYNHFIFTRVYPIDLGLGKRVVEKPIGYRRGDLIESVNKALESLNRNHSARIRAKGAGSAAAYPSDVIKYTLYDFIDCIYRNEPTTGTQYELYFQSVKHQVRTSASVMRALVMRPFAPLQTVQLSELSSSADNSGAPPSHSPPIIRWLDVCTAFAASCRSSSSSSRIFASS
ncbi:GM20871 [Drosophila sechellia]|uniref:GM20871 n=1 Tax=Drosophila sechellia TaxID=7238 RepID=B4IQ83_DROSE|nr:GM20871 [Drosophila sechellia]